MLHLEANAVGSGRLGPFDAQGGADNPNFGDRLSVTQRLDEHGRVTGIAHETNACVLAQASSSILGAQLAGAERRAVQELRSAVETMLHDGPPPAAPFADYAALTGAALHRNRHTCLLLPIYAALSALDT